APLRARAAWLRAPEECRAPWEEPRALRALRARTVAGRQRADSKARAALRRALAAGAPVRTGREQPQISPGVDAGPWALVEAPSGAPWRPSRWGSSRRAVGGSSPLAGLRGAPVRAPRVFDRVEPVGDARRRDAPAPGRNLSEDPEESGPVLELGRVSPDRGAVAVRHSYDAGHAEPDHVAFGGRGVRGGGAVRLGSGLRRARGGSAAARSVVRARLRGRNAGAAPGDGVRRGTP